MNGLESSVRVRAGIKCGSVGVGAFSQRLAGMAWQGPHWDFGGNDTWICHWIWHMNMHTSLFSCGYSVRDQLCHIWPCTLCWEPSERIGMEPSTRGADARHGFEVVIPPYPPLPSKDRPPAALLLKHITLFCHPISFSPSIHHIHLHLPTPRHPGAPFFTSFFFLLHHLSRFHFWISADSIKSNSGIWALYTTRPPPKLTPLHFFSSTAGQWASHLVLEVKNPPANAGNVRDVGSVPGSGRSPGGGHSNPILYSFLENPMDRGAWWATVRKTTQESDMTEAT